MLGPSGFVAIVDEEAGHLGPLGVGTAVIKERDRRVIGIEAGAPACLRRVRFVEAILLENTGSEDVGVPEDELSSSPVETPGFLAQSVNGVVRTDAAGHRERVVQVKITARVAGLVAGVFEDRRAVGAIGSETERSLGDHEAQAPGVQRDGVGAVDHSERGRAGYLEVGRERRIFVEGARLRNLETQKIGSQHVGPKLLLADIEQDSMLRLLEGPHIAERAE